MEAFNPSQESKKMSIYDAISALVANNLHKEACEPVGVAFKESGDQIIFDYEITADWKSPLPEICRGLVLSKTGQVLCSPMKKFWNSSETQAAPLDWNKAIAFEKMDGTMVNRWWNGQSWQVTTRYNIGDGLQMRMSDIHTVTWADLIEAALKTVDTSIQPIEETWTYEVCSPYNRVVVRYDTPFAVLLSRRMTATGEELPISSLPNACKTHNVSTLNDAVAYVSNFEGAELEGVVAFDGSNRVKIKNPSYVWWHHIRGQVGATWKNMLSVYLAGEQSEFVSQFPEFKAHFDTVASFFENSAEEAEKLFATIKSAPSRKEYAALVLASGTNMKNWLFNVYQAKYISAKDYLTALPEVERSRWAEAAGLKQQLEKIGSLAKEEV